MNSINAQNVTFNPDALLAEVQALESSDALQSLALESRQARIYGKRITGLRASIADRKDEAMKTSDSKKQLKARRAETILRGLADKALEKVQSAFAGMRGVAEQLGRLESRLASARQDLSQTRESSVTQNQVALDLSLAATGGAEIVQALQLEITTDRDLKTIFEITRRGEHARGQKELGAQRGAIDRQLKAMQKAGFLGKVFTFVNAIVLPAITIASAGAAAALAPASAALQKTVTLVLSGVLNASLIVLQQLPIVAAQKQMTQASDDLGQSQNRAGLHAQRAQASAQKDAQILADGRKVSDRLEEALQTR